MTLVTRMKLLWMKLILRASSRPATSFRGYEDLEGMGRRLARPPLPRGTPARTIQQKVESERAAHEARMIELIVRSIEAPW